MNEDDTITMHKISVCGTPDNTTTTVLITVKATQLCENHEDIEWGTELLDTIGDFFRSKGASYADIETVYDAAAEAEEEE